MLEDSGRGLSTDNVGISAYSEIPRGMQKKMSAGKEKEAFFLKKQTKELADNKE